MRRKQIQHPSLPHPTRSVRTGSDLYPMLVSTSSAGRVTSSPVPTASCCSGRPRSSVLRVHGEEEGTRSSGDRRREKSETQHCNTEGPPNGRARVHGWSVPRAAEPRVRQCCSDLSKTTAPTREESSAWGRNSRGLRRYRMHKSLVPLGAAAAAAATAVAATGSTVPARTCRIRSCFRFLGRACRWKG